MVFNDERFNSESVADLSLNSLTFVFAGEWCTTN